MPRDRRIHAQSTIPVTPSTRTLLAMFTTTLFLSAALVFLVQPMFAKMALPLLGGAPAVWNTCMLFFQAALLGGYLYAHATTRFLQPRPQVLLHLALLLISLSVLPIGMPPAWSQPSQDHPTIWLLALLLVSLGLPAFLGHFVVDRFRTSRLFPNFTTSGLSIVRTAIKSLSEGPDRSDLLRTDGRTNRPRFDGSPERCLSAPS